MSGTYYGKPVFMVVANLDAVSARTVRSALASWIDNNADAPEAEMDAAVETLARLSHAIRQETKRVNA